MLQKSLQGSTCQSHTGPVLGANLSVEGVTSKFRGSVDAIKLYRKNTRSDLTVNLVILLRFCLKQKLERIQTINSLGTGAFSKPCLFPVFAVLISIFILKPLLNNKHCCRKKWAPHLPINSLLLIKIRISKCMIEPKIARNSTFDK